MTSHTEVEATQAVARKTITTTLEHDSLWSVPLHNTPDDRLKDALVGDIVNTITERKVDSIVFSLANANIAELSGSREVLSVLMEGYGHHSVGGIERLLNTIAVMDIDIDIKNTLLETQKLQDAKNDVY
jgi:hypothetical protein